MCRQRLRNPCVPARQDKLLQKQHFQGHGIPLADFRSIGDEAELKAVGEEFGYPFMLKSRRRAPHRHWTVMPCCGPATVSEVDGC